MKQRGGNVDAAALINLWLGDHPAFPEVQNSDLWWPFGPWNPHPRAYHSLLPYNSILI